MDELSLEPFRSEWAATVAERVAIGVRKETA